MNRQAAREQAHGAEDGKFKHILGRWSRQALAHIKNVRDHKDCEDRGFSGNKGEHPHAPAGWEWPFLFHRYSCKSGAAQSNSPVYSYFQSGSSGCLRSQSGRRLLTTGSVAKLYSGGGEVVNHSSVHASHGSFPAGSPFNSDRRRLPTKTSTPAI